MIKTFNCLLAYNYYYLMCKIMWVNNAGSLELNIKKEKCCSKQMIWL